jgi:hypothetical protein
MVNEIVKNCTLSCHRCGDSYYQAKLFRLKVAIRQVLLLCKLSETPLDEGIESLVELVPNLGKNAMSLCRRTYREGVQGQLCEVTAKAC